MASHRAEGAEGMKALKTHWFFVLQMHVLVQKNKAILGGCHLYGEAREDTWTHSRRRRREAMRSKQETTSSTQSQSPPAPQFSDAPGDRKRQQDAPGEDDETAAKRRRIERLCEEGQAWMEELDHETSVEEEAAPQSLKPLLLRANFYVESQLRGYGGDDDDDDEDTGDIEISLENDSSVAAGKGDRVSQKVDRLILSVEWLGGTDREVANRVLCYLKNRLK